MVEPELNWPTSSKASTFSVIHGWIHYAQQLWFGYFKHLLPVSTDMQVKKQPHVVQVYI